MSQTGSADRRHGSITIGTKDRRVSQVHGHWHRCQDQATGSTQLGQRSTAEHPSLRTRSRPRPDPCEGHRTGTPMPTCPQMPARGHGTAEGQSPPGHLGPSSIVVHCLHSQKPLETYPEPRGCTPPGGRLAQSHTQQHQGESNSGSTSQACAQSPEARSSGPTPHSWGPTVCRAGQQASSQHAVKVQQENQTLSKHKEDLELRGLGIPRSRQRLHGTAISLGRTGDLQGGGGARSAHPFLSIHSRAQDPSHEIWTRTSGPHGQRELTCSRELGTG